MRKLRWIIASLAGLFIIGWLATPLPNPVFPQDYSTVVVDRHGRRLRVFLNSAEQWCFPPDTTEIPNKLVEAAIAYEDKRFYRHHGIDVFAIVRATWQNITERRTVSGASTITMQVARLSNPKRRTLFNKIIELFHSLKLELKHSKEEILRLYFTNAPYGGNIRGYKAACLRYWGVEPEQVTWGEAATLAVLPNSPSLINPDIGPKRLETKRNKLLEKLRDNGSIDDETYELSLLEPIPSGQLPFEFYAPHIARELHAKYPGEYVRTTIDRDIQRRVMNLAAEHADWLHTIGVNNVAVLVADTRTGEVLAYVGSNDFHDDGRRGKVDGVIAPRSTGSLLKPFLYALAMDESIILPESRIKDIPTYYGSFSPCNSTMDYRGLVTARDALVKSLNVPAVRLLYTFGIHEFYDFLRRAGMANLFRSPDSYGLPLILGGCEGTLWDLTALFRGLGRSGEFSGLTVIEGDSLPEVEALISPAACYLVLDMLKDLNRPGAEYYWHHYSNSRPIAWKTGTSYGHRDAWAIGVSPRWTIGVWVGNFTGEGNPNLMGAQSAGSLLFKVFNSLPENDEYRWFTPPDDLTEVEICAETGYLAKDECEITKTVLSPTTTKPLRKCPYHRTLFLNGAETYRVCSRCWEIGDVKEVTRTAYPPEVVQYMKEKGHTFSALPPHNPDCTTLSTDNPITIIYPTANANLLVPRGVEGVHQKIIAKAGYSVEKGGLYWYLDNEFIGSTYQKHEIPLVLDTGSHYLQVVDEEGHTASIKFRAAKSGR